MLSLEELKGMDIQTPNMDELVLMVFQLRGMREIYDSQVGPDSAPDWLNARLAEVSREMKGRYADTLAKRQRELESQLKGLQTPAERKQGIEAELARIKQLQAS